MKTGNELFRYVLYKYKSRSVAGNGSMKKKGFTLIELLVVISIIAVLLARLMPALKKAKNHAMTIVCLSNLKQLSLGIILHADADNGEPGVTVTPPVGERDDLVRVQRALWGELGYAP